MCFRILTLCWKEPVLEKVLHSSQRKKSKAFRTYCKHGFLLWRIFQDTAKVTYSHGPISPPGYTVTELPGADRIQSCHHGAWDSWAPFHSQLQKTVPSSSLFPATVATRRASAWGGEGRKHLRAWPCLLHYLFHNSTHWGKKRTLACKWSLKVDREFL